MLLKESLKYAQARPLRVPFSLVFKRAKKIEADYYSLSVLAPYYGTELYDQLIANGHALDQQPWEYFFHQSPKPMVNDKISKKVLEEYLALVELNNKSNKGYI